MFINKGQKSISVFPIFVEVTDVSVNSFVMFCFLLTPQKQTALFHKEVSNSLAVNLSFVVKDGEK